MTDDMHTLHYEASNGQTITLMVPYGDGQNIIPPSSITFRRLLDPGVNEEIRFYYRVSV